MSSTLIYITLFLAAFLSGTSILLFKGINDSKNLKLLLPFSGSFLLAICFLHLIPELYEDYQKSTGLYILAGFVIQLFLEIFSKGIEHGHFHVHEKKTIQFPYTLFISLCIHSVIEGMALTDPHSHHHFNNHSLLIGIIIHKIPITIVLITLFKSNNLSNTITTIALLLFSLSAPVGLFIANQYDKISSGSPKIFIAIAVGVFLHISTTILFETSENHKFNIKKYTIIILGLIAAVLTLQ
ncbi:MAG: ZIP family metal transporter [Vicingus serpentipes]|nr:ZIP family metal transporter [Vicingus serpentipes]